MMRRFFPSTIRQVSADLPFTFNINTNNTSTGSSTNTQFKLPLVNSGTYDFDVDWGDSTSDTITVWDEAATTHTYGATGTYTITITGQCEGWMFNLTGDRLKMITINQWGIIKFLTSSPIEGAFYGCSNMNVTATDKPILTTTLSGFFRGCTALVGNSSFGDWDVSTVNSLLRVFDGCSNFNQNINNWDVSSVTNMSQAFFGCSIFNQPLNNWNVSSVESFAQCFQSCTTFNQNLSAWDVSSAITFNGMFRACTAFNNGGDSGINDWNVSIGQIFGGNNQGMFQLCTNFNQPIGGWDMSSATNLFAMFQSANSFNQNIGAWNVSNVTIMQNLFFANTAFNNGGSDSIKNWSPSKVTNFISCFRSATAFNQPIGTWVLNSIGNISMNSMFRDSTAFNHPLGDWNVGKVTDFGLFMTGKTPANYSASNLDDIYNKWSLQTVTTGRTITFNTIKYTAAGQAGKDILEAAPNNWNITDGGI